MLAKPRVRTPPAKEDKAGRRHTARGAGGIAGAGDHDALFEALRSLRLQIARREGLPAYMIFNDATLREMAATRPADTWELLEVSGVGEKKLEKYGEEFLEVLRRGDLGEGPCGCTGEGTWAGPGPGEGVGA
jgi:ATP-dependent DNA helicase RecQ